MIYLDSCVVIYAVEDSGTRGELVRQRLADTPATVAISSLVVLECLVGPMRDDNLALRDHYLRAFEQFRRVDMDEDVYLRAAELRARHGLRTPDALHLAAAQISGCEELWTNDRRLTTVSRGLAIDVLGI